MKATFLALAMFAASATASATTIDTMSQSGFDFRCLGINGGCGQTFGQIFTVSTADTYLSSFSLAPTTAAGGSLNVQFNIYAWSGSNKTGSVLFQSGTDTLANGGGTTLLTYAPGLELTQGMQYIAYLNTAGLGNSTSATAGFSSIDDTYAGGNFVWERTAGSGTWFNTGGDTRFQAIFTAAPAVVPEPASLGLLGLGMAGLMLARRRKQK